MPNAIAIDIMRMRNDRCIHGVINAQLVAASQRYEQRAYNIQPFIAG
jgi:hypothetical protein